jgi:hypothetical protein
MLKLNFINKKYLKMDYNNLKSAIESGVILNDKLLLESGINLNTVMPYDDKGLQFRILAAMNIIANHYKDFSTNLSPLKTIIIVTNKDIYNKIQSYSWINDNDNIVLYTINNIDENYVCIGFQNDFNKSYTFKIE